MVLSKSDIKRINALKIKKYRVIEKQFVAEGQKIILDLIQIGLIPELLVTTKLQESLFNHIDSNKLRIASEEDLQKISSLKQSPGCLAIFNTPEPTEEIPNESWILATDDIQDPGNLGTLIRIADWFGIRYIVCSIETVDAYNSKVVQATMGSIGRVQIHYVDLEDFFKKNPTRKIYAGVLDGRDIRDINFAEPGILLIGNESKGIDKSLMSYVSDPVLIPRLGEAESLNAGVAAGIMVSFALLSR
ncbi:MAG TPA: RNA methyltransferase [Chitinophagales bacterium]|nr:RNA methyltransferase [Chitinophagales bacterium]